MCDTVQDSTPVTEFHDQDADPPFNVSTFDETAIENVDKNQQEEKEKECHRQIDQVAPTTGSDSGVEVAPEPLSCASSLISCGSAYEDSFASSVNGFEELKLSVIGDGTSEGGSESSSITGGGSSTKRVTSTKKKVSMTEPGRTPRPVPRATQSRAPALATRERARSREKSVPGDKPPPPTGPKPVVPPRNRPRGTTDALALICRESPVVKVKATKTSTVRCQVSSPSGMGDISFTKNRVTPDSKSAFDKYATLPRRKRDGSPDLVILKKEPCTDTSFYRSVNIKKANRDRESPPLRSLPPYPRNKFPGRIRIYHETSAQTALCGTDVEKALAGVGITEIRTDLVLTKKSNKSIQVDTRNKEIERLEAKIKQLTEANSKLQARCDEQAEKLTSADAKFEEERAEKAVAQQELQRNTERVLSMLGGDSSGCGDSLMLLESQLQTSANIVMRQQEEINKLHVCNKDLQQELDKSIKTCRHLENHLEETEQESSELQEFLQAEKNALQDALRDSEEHAVRLQRDLIRCRKECRLLVRISEQRRHEILAARAKLAVHRPAHVAPVALPALAQHLQMLLQTLINNYSIPKDDLEEIIFHNEAYSRSVSSEACSPGSPLPHTSHPLPGPSSAPIQISRFSDDDNSADLLDSETEPCLMMENILEDIAIPDAYSHNLGSSCPNDMSALLDANRLLYKENKEDSFSSLHNLTTFSGDELSPAVPDEKLVSESSYYPEMDTCDLLQMGYSEHDSLQNLSQAILHRQQSEAECSMSEDAAANRGECNVFSNASNSIVDQVLFVDNLVAKVLRMLKIINTHGDHSGNLLRIHRERINDMGAENGFACSENVETSNQEEGNGEHPSKWCPKGSTTVNGQKCTIEQELSSPKHVVSNLNECNINSPKPINSAA